MPVFIVAGRLGMGYEHIYELANAGVFSTIVTDEQPNADGDCDAETRLAPCFGTNVPLHRKFFFREFARSGAECGDKTASCANNKESFAMICDSTSG